MRFFKIYHPILLLLVVYLYAGCIKQSERQKNYKLTFNNIIPKPVSIDTTSEYFILKKKSKIYVKSGKDELQEIADYLAVNLKQLTGYKLPVKKPRPFTKRNSIYLLIEEFDSINNNEYYEIEITKKKIIVRAPLPQGLFRGVQTLNQIFPVNMSKSEKQKYQFQIPAGIIKDYPRFEWRGAMLDVARHFFSIDDVKRYIDLLSLYKINRFHIHLSDDQGWRIEIKSWPKLTEHGSSTQVGGGEGGYFTKEDYKEIVNYANEKYITVIPEIDMPGHTNAALSSYKELNCDSIAPKLYTGTQVGFSSLCVNKEITYKFIEDVIAEISSITPGSYFHIGGDEANSTKKDEYIYFMEKVQEILTNYEKKIVGWEEIAQINLNETSIVQHWNSNYAKDAALKGIKVIMSPSSKAYLDMKYNDSTTLGLDWAGLINIKDAYSWDPAEFIEGINEENIIGIEAPLWSETIVTMDDLEYMAFPRIIGYAEIGWSQKDDRNWDEYRYRLNNHKKRLTELGVNFYNSELIP